MSTLPTNYVDAVLNADVNTKRKYNMITNSDGTVSFEDVTDYTTEGDDYGAADINEQNGKINELSQHLTDNDKEFKFGYQNGEYGYYKQEGGADTFSPFKSRTPMRFNFGSGATVSGVVVPYTIQNGGFTNAKFKFKGSSRITIKVDGVTKYGPSEPGWSGWQEVIANLQPTSEIIFNVDYTSGTSFSATIDLYD